MNAPKGFPCPSIFAVRESTIHRKASSSFCSAQTSRQGPPSPTLRANPFPKVTDPICRLPLPTLFYRPEAANLGDLMRLWVRPGVQISLFVGSSGADVSAPDTSKDKVPWLPCNPCFRQSDSRVVSSQEEKTTLPKALTCGADFTCVTAQYPLPG